MSMHTLLLSGSPKRKDSVSSRLIEYMKAQLEQSGGEHGDTLDMYHVPIQDQPWDMDVNLAAVHAIVIAFPLYVDGIPGHLLRFMEQLEARLRGNENVTVYALINNGFYESHQNAIAMEMMQHFCKAVGATWGGGLAIGAGGMINAAPIGKSFNKKLGVAMESLAEHVRKIKPFGIQYIEPAFPRFLYMRMAHIGWRRMGKRNGLSSAALDRQLP